MPMPKTTMNKYNLFYFRENHIWLAGELYHIRTISISRRPDEIANDDLRLGVPMSD